ncbi:MAG: hypothetical protein H7Z73_10155 [Candidatus Saccharibacteria bacterium]|nr:hypothetical protein [Moraxellaceae bacterium]
MPITLTMSDGSLTGRVIQQFKIQIPTSKTTARQLIEQRIRQEVASYNETEKFHQFNGLVTPTESEVMLNEYEKAKPKKIINADLQYEKALEAFSSNRFFLLVDERQVTELDRELVVSEVSIVQFVKLVPLVGG